MDKVFKRILSLRGASAATQQSPVSSVAKCARNDMSMKVKIADIEDNIDVLRLASLDEKDLARIKKYHSAWRFLKEEL